MKLSYELMKHQRDFSKFWAEKQSVLNFSGCGTGKTLSCIHTVRFNWSGSRVLVLAPLSILQPAWGGDLNKFWPEVTWEIAYSTKRKKVFEGDAQWIIANHDAVKDIIKNGWESKFDVLIVDEADAFRNKDSQRSKAMAKLAESIQTKVFMTGTPTPKSVTDVWHLAYCVDGGERLGKNFYGFRFSVANPMQVAANKNAVQWVDKAGANDIVSAMLADITFRVNLQDVIELPETIYRNVNVQLPAKVRAQYETLKRESMLLMDSGELINAVHAGARMQKMLQTLSGAVYREDGGYVDMHTDRHKLVLDLVQETDAALVAFQWQHQKDGLVKEAKARKLNYAVIDGSVNVKERERIVARFQAGQLDVIFAHPQSAGHGLTLTRANRVIWASPTYRADLYEQFNHRIKRPGQKRRTEVIHIAADNTAEVEVYEKLMGKQANMHDLLGLLLTLSKAAKAA